MLLGLARRVGDAADVVPIVTICQLLDPEETIDADFNTPIAATGGKDCA